MANNAQKTPFAISMNRFAEKKANDAIQVLGKSLPCHVVSVAGQIVTVAFDIDAPPFTLPNVTMPMGTTIYDWIPIQIGDRGFAVPASTYMGGVSGLGGGVANLTQRANLSTLVFVPVSNNSWTAPGGDANKRVVQGPTGVFLQDMGGKGMIEIDEGNGITLSFGGHSIVINSTGVIIDGRVFLSHMHTGVQSGASDTGGVV